MNTKTINTDSGKFKKSLTSIKKVLSKEFLWALIIMAMCIPIALIVQYIISKDAHILNAQLTEDIEEVSKSITNKQPSFRVLYALSFIGIYFSRMVIAAIKTQFAG